MDVDLLERELATLSEKITAPLPQECLQCYLIRMLRDHGCTGHRFTRRWAASRPRGTEDGLVRWASDRGGCCCDCEVVMNSLRSPKSASRRGGVLCAAAYAYRLAELDWRDGDVEPAAPLTCSGVR